MADRSRLAHLPLGTRLLGVAEPTLRIERLANTVWKLYQSRYIRLNPRTRGRHHVGPSADDTCGWTSCVTPHGLPFIMDMSDPWSLVQNFTSIQLDPSGIGWRVAPSDAPYYRLLS